MNNKFSRKNILKLIDKILEHNYFKIVCLSIITSFILFNSISYFKNKFFETRKIEKISNIKINLGNFREKLNQIEDQILFHQVQAGETLSAILYNLGSNEADVNKILNATQKIFDPRNIFQGQNLKIHYKTIINYEDNNPNKNLIRKSIISKLSLSPDPELDMFVIRNEDGSYSSEQKKKELVKYIVKYTGKIKNSLYEDGVQNGISPRIMIEMINLYSFDVDFQRDLRTGDEYEVLFESYYDKDGNKVKDGNILYSNLDLRSFRNALESYYFVDGKISEYFDENGRSVRKSLLRTPINGARISSGFGYRRHPILGYRKKHKGLDFAARRGTPILAAGAGMIDYLGRRGGYGNYVRIKHNDEYSTAYAHAKGFARGLRKGSRVKQGQVIAYVGTTGRSTGPHLHYEVLRYGVQVNPSRMKTTSGIKLKGSRLTRFKARRDEIEDLRKNSKNNNKII